MTPTTPCWAKKINRIPGLGEQLYSDSMKATYAACYAGYHTEQHRIATQTLAPNTHFTAALRWLAARGKRHMELIGEEEEKVEEKEEEWVEKVAEEKEDAATTAVV